MRNLTVKETRDSAYGGVNLLFYQHRGRSAEDSAEETGPTSHESSHRKEMAGSAYGTRMNVASLSLLTCPTPHESFMNP